MIHAENEMLRTKRQSSLEHQYACFPYRNSIIQHAIYKHTMSQSVIYLFTGDRFLLLTRTYLAPHSPLGGVLGDSGGGPLLSEDSIQVTSNLNP